EFEAGNRAQEVCLLLLPEGLDHHADIETKFRSRHWGKAFAAGAVLAGPHRPDTFQTSYMARSVVDDANGSGLPQKHHVVVLGQLKFVIKCRHLFATPAIDHINVARAKTARRRHNVDSSISAADHGDARGHLDFI